MPTSRLVDLDLREVEQFLIPKGVVHDGYVLDDWTHLVTQVVVFLPAALNYARSDRPSDFFNLWKLGSLVLLRRGAALGNFVRLIRSVCFKFLSRAVTLMRLLLLKCALLLFLLGIFLFAILLLLFQSVLLFFLFCRYWTTKLYQISLNYWLLNIWVVGLVNPQQPVFQNERQ